MWRSAARRRSQSRKRGAPPSHCARGPRRIEATTATRGAPAHTRPGDNRFATGAEPLFEDRLPREREGNAPQTKGNPKEKPARRALSGRGEERSAGRRERLLLRSCLLRGGPAHCWEAPPWQALSAARAPANVGACAKLEGGLSPSANLVTRQWLCAGHTQHSAASLLFPSISFSLSLSLASCTRRRIRHLPPPAGACLRDWCSTMTTRHVSHFLYCAINAEQPLLFPSRLRRWPTRSLFGFAGLPARADLDAGARAPLRMPGKCSPSPVSLVATLSNLRNSGSFC